jgi:hypothetical protein
MTTLSTIKKLAASTAIAGSLGLAALGLGSGLALATPSTDSGSGTASSAGQSSPASQGTGITTPGATAPSGGEHNTPGTTPHGPAGALTSVEPQNEIFLEDWYDGR